MGRRPIEKKRINDPQTRAKWIAHLKPIYMKNGFRKFSMDDVAKHLGVSKATVYKHFSSRTEILEAVIGSKIREIAAFEESVSDQSIPYMTRYRNAIKNASLKLAGISNQTLLDLHEIYPNMWKQVTSLQYFATERGKAFYQEGVEKGILNDLDPTWLAIMDRIFIIGLSDPQLLIENDLTLQKAVDNYFKLKSQGIFKIKIEDE